MSNRDFQCANCGHLFNMDNPYYSEDFARVAEYKNIKVAISWCLHCNHISEYRQKKIFGFIPTGNYAYVSSFSIEKLIDKDYYNKSMDEYGGLFGFHIMRMIWASINAREKMKAGEKHTTSLTILTLIDKVPPIYAATAILAVSNTHQSVPLEYQIEYGIYQSSEEWSFLEKAVDIITENTNWPNRDAVLEILNDARKPGR